MRKFLLTLAILVVLVGWFVFDLFRDAGEFKDIEPHFSGSVERVEGAVGAEDITIHRPSGVAFISSDDRRAVLRGEESRGAIYSYALRAEQPELIELSGDFPGPFHPHGIGLHVDDAGQTRLFVINHRTAEEHTVEIFAYFGDSLGHVESITDPALLSPNDLVAVGPRSFYVTNDHGSTSELGRTLEEYLRLPKAHVLFFNGQTFTKVADDIKFANGINMSRDGRTVYVAGTVGGKIHVYDRDSPSGELSKRSEIDLDTGVDNIELDTEGNLWIGAHPKLLTFVKHVEDASRLSPSQVLRVRPMESGGYDVTEVFLDDGSRISGSSVAAAFENRMLVGSVFEPHFLVCQLDGLTAKD